MDGKSSGPRADAQPYLELATTSAGSSARRLARGTPRAVRSPPLRWTMPGAVERLVSTREQLESRLARSVRRPKEWQAMNPGRHARACPIRQLRCCSTRLRCFAGALCSPAELRRRRSQAVPGRASASETLACWRRVPQGVRRPNQPVGRAAEERRYDRRLLRSRDPDGQRFRPAPSRGVRAPQRSTRRRPRRCRGWAHPSPINSFRRLCRIVRRSTTAVRRAHV